MEKEEFVETLIKGGISAEKAQQCYKTYENNPLDMRITPQNIITLLRIAVEKGFHGQSIFKAPGLF